VRSQSDTTAFWIHVYLAVMALDLTGKRRARWTQPWKQALDAFGLAFDGRLSAHRR
jgi:putative transposase